MLARYAGTGSLALTSSARTYPTSDPLTGMLMVSGAGEFAKIRPTASSTGSIGYGDSRYRLVGPARGSFDIGRSSGRV